ncbi:OSCP-domain-containing protein [Rozella allomycis CSF55]|uniref:ATP synthase subunit 5, mitochondrial n=1 Tax=Rozella allomycis (strain CSF55) TaxID=988480 RepID=A0A4V1J071_ROZAC|nr:OSCP-domain-containing protein [Rozella allomycis CSF55]
MTTKNTVEDHDEQSHIKNSVKNNEVKENLSSSDNVTSKETEKSEPETYANAATNSNSDKEASMKSGDEKCNDKQSPDNALNHKEEMKRKQSDEPESANVKKSKSDSSIKIGPIEKKYAQALFNVSLKMNSIPNTSEELGKIKVSMETNEKMRLFVEDPSVGPEKKRTIIQSMLKSYSPTVKNFFDTLLTNGRLPLSMSIINAFEDIVKEHRKEMIVKIVSAKELDSKYLLQLQDIISKNFVDKGKNITFVTSIKQEILGGVIVEVGDKTLDLSILNKVNNMKKSLEQGF